MKQTIKRIWDIVSTVLVALIVLAAVLLVGTRVSGMHAYTVLSGSMEPTYHVGALVFVRPAEAAEVRVGDPITYLAGEKQVVTHRCVEVLPDADEPGVVRFRTKGDANNTEDGTLVHSSNLIGKPVFSIPLLGYVANYIQNPPGTYVAIAFAALILVLTFWPDGGKKGGKTDTADTKQDTTPPERGKNP